MSKTKKQTISLLTIVFLLFSNWCNAQIKELDLDSLWNVVRSEQYSDTNKVDALSKIASQYFNTYPDSTLFFLEQSIALAQAIEYPVGVARGYMNMGAVTSFRGDIPKAVEYTIKALETIEQTTDTSFQIQILTNLAGIMINRDEFDKGLAYAKKAQNLAEQTSDVSSQITALNILANVKESEGKIDEAIKYYQKHTKIAEENNLRNQDYFYSLLGVASCYTKKYHDFDSTIQWIEKIHEVKEHLNSLNTDIAYYQNTASTYLNFGKLEQAELYADSLKMLAPIVGGKRTLIDYLMLKASIEEDRGLYKSAYEYYKKAKAYEDSLNDEKREETILALEMKYNSEKKGKELLLKKAELEKQAIEVENQKNQKTIMMVIFGFGTVFTWFVIFSYFKNRKKNKLLERQNEELEKLSIVAKEVDSTVIITDKNGVIEWINEGIMQMYELTPEEVEEKIGKNIREISDFQGISNIIDECLKTKRSSFYTSKHFKKSGSVLWVQTTLTPILNQDGEVNKIVFIDTNVSAVKKSEVKLTEQKYLLETKNNQITDSFNYAKRIQQAVLPSNETMSSVWKEYFAILNPKDIVSGDFYWFYKKENKKYLAVVDCTGHGVPGAFMTIIGNNLLNEILQDDFEQPEDILQELHTRIKIRLGGSKDAKVMDSMDLGLACYDTTKKEICFSGTHTSIYMVRGSTLTEFKGSKETIGFKDKITLKTHRFEVKNGDMLYMHTDGYPDQKGGKKNKKFYYQPIRNMFVSIAQKDMETQKQIVEKTFEEWKGNNEQTDDVCVVGVRIV